MWLQVGDEVVALAESKAWAELSSVPAKFVYKIPSGMSFQDAAALTMNFVVAYILVNDVGNIKEGNSVLIHSAGGGVVSFQPLSSRDKFHVAWVWSLPLLSNYFAKLWRHISWF